MGDAVLELKDILDKMEGFDAAQSLVAITDLGPRLDNVKSRTQAAKMVLDFLPRLPDHHEDFASGLLAFIGCLAEIEPGLDGGSIAEQFLRQVARLAKEYVKHEEEDERGGLSCLESSMASVLSVCEEVRALATCDADLCTAATQLRWKAHFLYKICSVLDGTELVVIHPEQGWGFLVRSWGVSNNWQLHQLLAHALHGYVEQPHWNLLHPAVFACLSGVGPCEVNASMVGVWNMYCWTAVSTDKSVDGADLMHWVWGEGVPKDIMPCPALEGRRVLLLGRPHMYGMPINRGMACSRDFAKLGGKVEIIKNLEVTTAEYLKEMASIEDGVKQAAAEEWMDTINRH